MEDTCSKECHLWKKYKEECPNFMHTTWKSKDSDGKVIEKSVRDCSTKRTLIEFLNVHDRVVAIEKVIEELKNIFIGIGVTIEQKRLELKR